MVNMYSLSLSIISTASTACIRLSLLDLISLMTTVLRASYKQHISQGHSTIKDSVTIYQSRSSTIRFSYNASVKVIQSSNTLIKYQSRSSNHQTFSYNVCQGYPTITHSLTMYQSRTPNHQTLTIYLSRSSNHQRFHHNVLM